jgi:3D (Asp-Asp-Asp) domain-containing protein
MVLLSRSVPWKILATVLAGMVFTLVYEATVHDSRLAVEADLRNPEPPQTGVHSTFEATAYCRGQITASGIPVRAGMAASDPKILPLGSIIKIDRIAERYQGIYSVLDTGPEIEGREVDLYMWNCDEAKRFGRQKVVVTVLRRGWVEGDTRK